VPARAQAPSPAGVPDRDWAFAVLAYGYKVPDEPSYVQPTVMADHRWLHLETRYNYEDLGTGSAWIGYNLTGGHTVEWEVTPMFGAVFGAVTGVAPGGRGALAWGRLHLSNEVEYVVGTSDHESNFLFSWSEITATPVAWLHVGFAEQRTHADRAGPDVQPGFTIGASLRRFDVSGYVFEAHGSRVTVMLGLIANF
jgi:hypothetical protein